MTMHRTGIANVPHNIVLQKIRNAKVTDVWGGVHVKFNLLNTTHKHTQNCIQSYCNNVLHRKVDTISTLGNDNFGLIEVDFTLSNITTDAVSISELDSILAK